MNVKNEREENAKLTGKDYTVKVTFFAHGEHRRDGAAAGKFQNSVLDEQDLTSNVFMVGGKLFQG